MTHFDIQLTHTFGTVHTLFTSYDTVQHTL